MTSESCPIFPPPVAGALMGELYSEGLAIYSPDAHTTSKNGKDINPKSIGEETYGLIIAEAYEMVSAINNRANESQNSSAKLRARNHVIFTSSA